MKNKIYVGIKPGLRRELFKSQTEPTESTHGHLYNAVIGPFITMGGAAFMRDYGQGNPHCQHVRDAEQLAAHYSLLPPFNH